MKIFRYILPMLFVCGVANVQAAAEPTERDILSVEKFIKSKRSVTVSEKGGELSLAGDVRVEFQDKHSRVDGVKINGRNSAAVSSQFRGHVEMDVEFNLYVDYKTDNTWAHATLEFDQNYGLSSKAATYVDIAEPTNVQTQGSGQTSAIKLEKAFFGMNIWDNGDCRLDVEIGRRPLYSIFDSRVQFYSNFDGLLIRYNRAFDNVGDFYVNAGQFLIDSNYNHFGYVTEFGLLNIADLGLDIKYSYIDHSKTGSSGHDGSDNLKDNAGFRFRNSQLTFAYHLNPELIGYPVKFYGAFLHNHDAKKPAGYNKTRNEAWYLGASYGSLKKEGDIALDLNYQRVEHQAVAGHEVSGIGTGDWRGMIPRSNYKGFAFNVGYNITDNVNAVLEYELSDEIDANFVNGHTHKYRKLEVELKYAF